MTVGLSKVFSVIYCFADWNVLTIVCSHFNNVFFLNLYLISVIELDEEGYLFKNEEIRVLKSKRYSRSGWGRKLTENRTEDSSSLAKSASKYLLWLNCLFRQMKAKKSSICGLQLRQIFECLSMGKPFLLVPGPVNYPKGKIPKNCRTLRANKSS